MERCKDCELALYCFSDSSTWVFRTKQEMDEKRAAMLGCPFHKKAQEACSAGSEYEELQAS
jgi:hypothetical protein